MCCIGRTAPHRQSTSTHTTTNYLTRCPAPSGPRAGGAYGSFVGPGGPVALNNNRLIAGNRESGSATAYTYDYASGTPGTTTTIPPYFRSIEINDAGTVVGSGDLKGKGAPTIKAITYNAVGGKKQLTDLTSYATAINELGQVAGEVYSTSGSPGTPDDAFIYDPVAKFWRISGLIQVVVVGPHQPPSLAAKFCTRTWFTPLTGPSKRMPTKSSSLVVEAPANVSTLRPIRILNGPGSAMSWSLITPSIPEATIGTSFVPAVSTPAPSMGSPSGAQIKGRGCKITRCGRHPHQNNTRFDPCRPNGNISCDHSGPSF